jgi:hypothetical protein
LLLGLSSGESFSESLDSLFELAQALSHNPSIIASLMSSDVTLTANITNEVSNRASGDIVLSTRISNEEVSRASGDAVLSTDILTEISNRASGDIVLSTRISNEEVSRASGDVVLSTDFSSSLSTALYNTADVVTSISINTGLSNDVGPGYLYGFINNVTLGGSVSFDLSQILYIPAELSWFALPNQETSYPAWYPFS